MGGSGRRRKDTTEESGRRLRIRGAADLLFGAEALPGHLVSGGVDTEGLMPTITTTAWWIRPSRRSMSFKMV